MLDVLAYLVSSVLVGAEPPHEFRLCSADYEPRMQTVDEGLFELYLNSSKVDWPKEKRRVIGRKKKVRWITVRKLKAFGWKDVAAAERVGMGLRQYVIEGGKPNFRLPLYCMLAAAKAAGHDPVITSLFRNDWRQSIAEGVKARANASYHGGSKHGGYGHGEAADVTTRGTTESRLALWRWIDEHGKHFGIGRPYGQRDPPHLAPLGGREYAHKGSRASKIKLAKNKKKSKKVRLAKH